ncbi:MAG: DUF5667 domain-containing protein [Candidatus Daviesbacteria bacterium]|nr:DUF5667 domain-containing protein [Candidatus Daviesbacteria bacterium]
MKKILVLLFLLIFVQTSYATEFEKLNLPSQGINPGDFYYSSTRLWEKIADKFQFNKEAKFKYANSLIDKRMSELAFVVKNKRLDEIQRSSQRLAYQVGTLTEFLIKQGDKVMKEQTRTQINSFTPALSELRDNFPANSSYWMLVQHDINSLKEYSEKLSK